MSDPVIRKRGGENYPAWRDREGQADVLAALAADAVREAILEEGLPPYRLQLETRYHQGRTEPHTSYGEVRVFDSDDDRDSPDLELIVSPINGDARRLRIREAAEPGVAYALEEDRYTGCAWRPVGREPLERVEIDGEVYHGDDAVAETEVGP